MKKLTTVLALFVIATAASVVASGPVGIYGIIEKVVFEPTEAAPERIQLWGAFAYADGGVAGGAAAAGGTAGLSISKAARGYLYFKLRSSIPGFTTEAQVQANRKEWADLKTVAGTGQAVGFGKWGYIARFDRLDPNVHPVPPSVVLEAKPQGGEVADMRVRPASERPANPATYQTDSGIVKIPDQGSHAAIVKQLKEALKSSPR